MDGVWNPPTRPKVDRAVNAILSRQLDDGGFNIYLHGPAEISASIKAYFALKIAGLSVFRLADDAPPRSKILELGGLQAANSYVRTNLSLFGSLSARSLSLHSAGGGPPSVRLYLPDVGHGRGQS